MICVSPALFLCLSTVNYQQSMCNLAESQRSCTHMGEYQKTPALWPEGARRNVAFETLLCHVLPHLLTFNLIFLYVYCSHKLDKHTQMLLLMSHLQLRPLSPVTDGGQSKAHRRQHNFTVFTYPNFSHSTSAERLFINFLFGWSDSFFKGDMD